MHLVSTRRQIVHLGSQEFSFEPDEYITTEYSYKYSVTGFAGIALSAGFELVKKLGRPKSFVHVLVLARSEQFPAVVGKSFRRFG